MQCASVVMHSSTSAVPDLFSLACSLAAYFHKLYPSYEGWKFNSGNYLFTTDTK